MKPEIRNPKARSDPFSVRASAGSGFGFRISGFAFTRRLHFDRDDGRAGDHRDPVDAGVALFFKAFHKDPLRQATSDIAEVCSNARARAILGGEPTEVVIRPEERRGGQRRDADRAAAPASPPRAGGGDGMAVEVPMSRPGSGLSATWSDRLVLQLLDVNFVEYKDAEEARVRFYPNGTCDELRIVLLSERGEQRGVDLELTTGLAEVATADDIRGWLKQ